MYWEIHYNFSNFLVTESFTLQVYEILKLENYVPPKKHCFIKALEIDYNFSNLQVIESLTLQAHIYKNHRNISQLNFGDK